MNFFNFRSFYFLQASLAFFMIQGFTIAASNTQITGAGATFPYPIYSKWFNEYKKNNSKVDFNYQSIGSGGGIQQLLNQTVDFGASDAPVSDADLKKAAWPILHIPTVMGSVALIYNMPGVSNLRISPAVLADIMLGKITKWDDVAIVKLNPSAKIPKNKDITVVTRADGSGTTSIFTDYLSITSSDWKSKVGSGKSVAWPVGISGKGNEGVTGIVQRTDGSIGYVELAYALTNKLSFFAVQNQDNQFVLPTSETTSQAANSLTNEDYKGDLRLSIVNAKGKNAYPISSFTYILLPLKKGDIQNKEVRNFLLWALTKGQSFASDLHYASLPTKLSEALIHKLEAIKD